MRRLLSTMLPLNITNIITRYFAKKIYREYRTINRSLYALHTIIHPACAAQSPYVAMCIRPPKPLPERIQPAYFGICDIYKDTWVTLLDQAFDGCEGVALSPNTAHVAITGRKAIGHNLQAITRIYQIGSWELIMATENTDAPAIFYDDDTIITSQANQIYLHDIIKKTCRETYDIKAIENIRLMALSLDKTMLAGVSGDNNDLITMDLTTRQQEKYCLSSALKASPAQHLRIKEYGVLSLQISNDKQLVLLTIHETGRAISIKRHSYIYYTSDKQKSLLLRDTTAILAAQKSSLIADNIPGSTIKGSEIVLINLETLYTKKKPKILIELPPNSLLYNYAISTNDDMLTLYTLDEVRVYKSMYE